MVGKLKATYCICLISSETNIDKQQKILDKDYNLTEIDIISATNLIDEWRTNEAK